MTEWKEMDYWTEYDAIHNASSKKDAIRRIGIWTGAKAKKVRKGSRFKARKSK